MTATHETPSPDERLRRLKEEFLSDPRPAAETVGYLERCSDIIATGNPDVPGLCDVLAEAGWSLARG